MPWSSRELRNLRAARSGYWAVNGIVWVGAIGTIDIASPESDAGILGILGLAIAPTLAVWLWLPISILPRQLLRADEAGRLWIPTARGTVTINLSRLASVDAWTFPGRPPVPLVRLRDRSGSQGIVTWDFATDRVQRAVRIAADAADGVSPRAKALLTLPGAPGRAERVRLALQTAGVYGLFLAASFLLLIGGAVVAQILH